MPGGGYLVVLCHSPGKRTAIVDLIYLLYNNQKVYRGIRGQVEGGIQYLLRKREQVGQSKVYCV